VCSSEGDCCWLDRRRGTRGYSLIDEIRALTPERGAEEVPFEPDGLTGDGRVGYISKTTTPARSTLGPTRPV